MTVLTVPTQRTVVAFVDDDDLDRVVALATSLAARDAATLVVYALHAAHAFSRVRPTWWSADRQQTFDGALTPVQLEMLGEHALAVAVQRARQSGVDSWGWLPEQRGAAGVERYARAHRADVAVIGSAHADLGGKLARDRDVVTA